VWAPEQIAANRFFKDVANRMHANSQRKRNTTRKHENMTHPMNSNLLIRSSLAVAFALAIWSPVQARSAEPAERKDMKEENMMDRCQDMMEQKETMKAEMKAQDAELTEQVANMTSAPEDKKMSLMAAVITRLVEQRIARDEKKAKMEEQMMKHMMQNMPMGKDSLSQCPMMKGMKDMDHTSAAPHKEPQEAQK
jgi:hypothetical protein